MAGSDVATHGSPMAIGATISKANPPMSDSGTWGEGNQHMRVTPKLLRSGEVAGHQ